MWQIVSPRFDLVAVVRLRHNVPYHRLSETNCHTDEVDCHIDKDRIESSAAVRQAPDE